MAIAESASSDEGIDNEDIEEEFKKLELEVESENSQVMILKTGVNEAARETLSSESAESLSVAFSSLGLGDGPATASASAIQTSVEPFRNKESENRMPEAA